MKGRENDLLQIISANKDYVIKGLLNDTANAFIVNDSPEDLPRIRKALDDEVIAPRKRYVDYIKRWGSHIDIDRLIRLNIRINSKEGATSLLSPAVGTETVAAAIIKLSGQKLPVQISGDIPDGIKAAIIKIVDSTSFKKIPRKSLRHLLSSRSGTIRKAAALKILTSSNQSMAKSILNTYQMRDAERYYNVVFWLDLAEAFDVRSYRALAEAELAVLSC